MISIDKRWFTNCARTATICASAVVMIAFCAPPAFAGGRSGKSGGALSNTTRSVRGATSAPSRPSSGTSSGTSSNASSHSTDYHNDHHHPSYCSTCTYTSPGRRSAGAPGQRSRLPTRMALDLGAQSVEDSDGALYGTVRLTRGNMGIGLSGTRYFERAPALDGSDTIHMNIWSMTFAGRGLSTANTGLWFDGGIGGATSNEFESMMGATVGARLEHALSSSLSVEGSVRYFVLEDGMRAQEVRAAVSASYVTLGYRVFSFNVGSRLHGPEFGLSLRY